MKLSQLRSISISSALTIAAVTSLSQAQDIQPPAQIPSQTKKAAPAEPEIKISAEEMRKEISYGLGFQNGEQYASHGFQASDLDRDSYLRGLLEALNKKDYASDPKKFDAAMRAFDKLVSARETELAKKNLAQEKAFFEKNSKRKEIVTTASGLQYEIIKKGTGKTYTQPAGVINGTDAQTEFQVFTRTTLLDGTVLNENKTDKPERYSLQVIQGLAEALKIMPIGSKWKLYVPSKLAFGNRRFGAKVGPNSVIVYEIELKDMQLRAVPPQAPQR